MESKPQVVVRHVDAIRNCELCNTRSAKIYPARFVVQLPAPYKPLDACKLHLAQAVNDAFRLKARKRP